MPTREPRDPRFTNSALRDFRDEAVRTAVRLNNNYTASVSYSDDVPLYDPVREEEGVRESIIDGITFRTLQWRDGQEYATSLRQAFPFFRLHADGRYSDRTLMRLSRAVDQYDPWYRMTQQQGTGSRGRTAVQNLDSNMPLIFVANAPFSYDEETEVKTGGTVGMIVHWVNDDAKSIIAVHGAHRRKGIGAALMADMRYGTTRSSWWVARTNLVGQHFLLSQGMLVTAMNGSGALRYAQNDNNDE